MSTRISGIYLWLEGTETEIESLQFNRESTWSTEKEAIRYKDDNGIIHWVHENVSLDTLTDVTVTSPTNGDILHYDGTNWINASGSLTGLWTQDSDKLTPVTDPNRLDLGDLTNLNLDAKLMVTGNLPLTTLAIPTEIYVNGSDIADVNGRYIQVTSGVEHWKHETHDFWISTGNSPYDHIYVISIDSNDHVDYWDSDVIYYRHYTPFGDWRIVSNPPIATTVPPKSSYQGSVMPIKYSIKAGAAIKTESFIACDYFVAADELFIGYNSTTDACEIHLLNAHSNNSLLEFIYEDKKFFNMMNDGTFSTPYNTNTAIDAATSGYILITRDYLNERLSNLPSGNLQDLQSVTDLGASTTNIMSYGSHPTFTSDTQLVDKKYVDDNTGSSSLTLQDVTTNGNETTDDIIVGTSTKNITITDGNSGSVGILLNDNGQSAMILFDEPNSAISINHKLVGGSYIEPQIDTEYTQKGYVDQFDVGYGNANEILYTDATGSGYLWAAAPSSAVDSVFGRTGAIVANSGDYTASLITTNNSSDVQTELDKKYEILSGITDDRPASAQTGLMYFSTDLGYPIWFDGTNWVNATGAYVIGPK